MRLRHIEVVNAIRVTGTLKAAAALLSLTQPAITQTLQSAERQLGYPLFERVRGKLIPTREAQTLFPELMRLDEQLQAVQRLAENLRGGTDESSIRILAAPAMAQTVVADAALAFISIRSDFSATAVANIALMEADIGVLYHSVSHPAIKEIELASSRLVCVGHPDVLDEAPFMEISELEGREIIGPDPADPLGRLLAKRLEELSVTARLTIVDEIAALSASVQGLNVVPLAPEIVIPVVASVAINGERSALVEQFMQVCMNTFRTLYPRPACRQST
jgi:DNA-binding transcriptional LysR family regulator